MHQGHGKLGGCMCKTQGDIPVHSLSWQMLLLTEGLIFPALVCQNPIDATDFCNEDLQGFL